MPLDTLVKFLPLKQLEDEDRRLKCLEADLTIDKQMLQDVLKKSFEALCEERFGS